MSIIVNGGIVSVANNPKVKASIITITFEGSRVQGQVPVNSIGVMLIKNVPDYRNFINGDILDYKDSNNNNDAQLTINSVVGPTKYKVTRTA